MKKRTKRTNKYQIVHVKSTEIIGCGRISVEQDVRIPKTSFTSRELKAIEHAKAWFAGETHGKITSLNAMQNFNRLCVFKGTLGKLENPEYNAFLYLKDWHGPIKVLVGRFETTVLLDRDGRVRSYWKKGNFIIESIL